jgi:catechol 2,3-dioxygenase-like lactoylglutathione lyase family enzyme
MAMLDHISIGCRDIAASAAFYDAALAPLGLGRVLEKGAGICYGPGPGREGMMFWIVSIAPDTGVPLPSRGTHIAFSAANRAAVDSFFHAATAAGARVNGAPGLRPEYSETYYGAFVLDPDGHKIEAMCRTAE